jgi:hypothetical protein
MCSPSEAEEKAALGILEQSPNFRVAIDRVGKTAMRA